MKQQSLRDQVNMALASKSLTQGLSGINNPMNPLQPFIFLPLFDGRFGFPPNLNPATLAAAAAAANGFPPGLLVNAAAAAGLSGNSLGASSLSSGSGSSRGTNDSRRSPSSPSVNKSSNGHSVRPDKRRNSGSSKSTPLNNMTKDDFESRNSLQNQPLNLKRSSSSSSQHEDARMTDPFFRALSGMYPGMQGNGFPPGFLMNSSLNHGSQNHSNGPNMSPGSSRGTPSDTRRSPFSPHHHHDKNSSNGRSSPVSKKSRSNNNNNHHDGHLVSNQSEPMNLTRSSPSSHPEDFRLKNHIKAEAERHHHHLLNQSQPQPMNLTSSRSSFSSSHHQEESRHNNSTPYYHPLAGMQMFPDFGKEGGNPFAHHTRFPGMTPGNNRTPFPFGLFTPGMDAPHHQSPANSHLVSNSSKKDSGPGSGGSGGFSDSSNIEDKKEDTVVTCQSELLNFIMLFAEKVD
jgi:hypothetical protein